MTLLNFTPGDIVRVHHPGRGQADWKNVECIVLEDDGRYDKRRGPTRFLLVRRLSDGHEDGIPLSGIGTAWEVTRIAAQGRCGECAKEFRAQDLDYLCPACRLTSGV